MNEQQNESRGESVEQAVVRRRKLLKKSVILGVPLLLTLPGRAFAQSTQGSVSLSENLSRGIKTT